MLRTIKKFQVLSTCAKVRDVRQNKGSILKASVDYIKLLRRDKEKRSAVEERCKKLEQNHRRALLKIQVSLWAIIQKSGCEISVRLFMILNSFGHIL